MFQLLNWSIIKTELNGIEFLLNNPEMKHIEVLLSWSFGLSKCWVKLVECNISFSQS